MVAQGRTYVYPFYDHVENLEKYRPGGLHPICVGDKLRNGRYTILNKLGHGGSSTVWLARDEFCHTKPYGIGPQLVALKVLSAEESTSGPHLEAHAAQGLTAALHQCPEVDHVNSHLGFAIDHFQETGPNGIRLCLVLNLFGPSIYAVRQSVHSRMEGSRRLRADLARKTAKQAADAIAFMHSAGFVHGGEFH
jgi:serine/threonine-protein kinase SRPK3